MTSAEEQLDALYAELPTIDCWLGIAPCCDMHNRHCEPPGDLCCGRCTEAAHDTFPIRHGDGSSCVLDAIVQPQRPEEGP